MSDSVDYKRKNLDALRADVNDTKKILTVTVDKLVERGDRLDALTAKADDLNTSSVHFYDGGRRVNRKMKWQNRKVSICIGKNSCVGYFAYLCFLFSCTCDNYHRCDRHCDCRGNEKINQRLFVCVF